MTTQHTAALVAAARAGDARAQDELVSTYLPLVYNIVGRALNGSCDVDDVVQDTMLRALDGLGTLRSDESFRSWLVAIAMNRVRAHWQARHSAPGESGLEAAWELADPGADFVDLTVLRLQLEGQQRETARATRWLETDDRALLSLWWLECAGELTRAEVAAALELSPQHTAVRVQRMKAQLESARVVERALGTQPPCEALRTVTTGWDGLPSTLWRKRIARHARECVQCAGLWGGLLPAEGLLAGLALVPVSVALLAGVRAAAAGGIVPAGAAYAYDGGAGAHAGGLGGPATGTGPGFDGTDLGSTGFDGTGFGGQDFGGTGFDGADFSDAATQLTPTVSGQGGIPDAGAGGGRSVLRKRRRSRRRAIGGAVLAACVAGGGLAYLGGFPGSNDEETGAAPATPVSALSAPDAGSAPPSDSASPSASASPSPSASASPSPSAESPSPSPSPTKSKAPASPPPAPAPAPAPAGVAGQVIALVNSERAAAGCGPLKEDPQLRAAAQGHSDDMAARDFFAHTNPDGADPGKRTTASGYRWSTYGENIAKGQQTAASVMDSWMKSPGHRANILNCSFKDIGVGIHTGPGGPWWTQNFGAKM
ncbi:sigma-70 family RNA polymerase sigma factor [Streptomyces sp. XY332]|uniref:sigma-70 family RNA polymerase sigma factor n=1 Tax=Streptomyces sp. XY332 TaxID=1415561 RepID=UPI0006B22AE5|nr:sigma-70 family RNA polymerase sigma factor [Streptomyces sp. XY332]KOY54180.1 RNA polymerase [Streptomyces sp. XY332]